MKTFWIAVGLLGVMLACVIGNALYINKVVNELEAQVEALPQICEEGCFAAACEIRNYWEERRDFLEMTVRFSFSDRISEQAETLVACISCGDVFGFATAKALLLDAIGDLKRAEQVSTGV